MKFAPAILLALAFGAVPAASAAPVLFSAQGSAPADITATVSAFRGALGALNVNVAGSFGSGRREINWDGVPDALATPNNLPANFFNTNSPRGVVFSTPGSGFQVSASSSSATPLEFGNLNLTYSSLFQPFSPQRLFTALGSNLTDVDFFVPGSTTTASVSAFGAVFTDVDLPNVTSLQFFDLSNQSLGSFFVPAATGNETLSFLGVRFDAGERIGRVRITAGNAALGGNEGGGVDLVVMDDFIYAEPTAVSTVPEPATLLLVGPLLAALWILRRRRLRYGQQEDSLRRLCKVTSRW